MALTREHKQEAELEGFLHRILESHLTEKSDAVKIVRCLIYIKHSMSLIKWAVDNKQDCAIYRSKKDQANGVLRDQEGTSFHINEFKSGEQAEKQLTAYLEQVENTLKILNHEQQLEFARKMQWNKDVGCLEARLAHSMQWAACLQSSPLRQLDDIAALAVKANQGNSLTLDLFKGFCHEHDYKQCIYQNKDVDITDQLLNDYMVSIWGEAKEVKQEAKPHIQEQKSHAAKEPIQHIQVAKNTLEYHFVTTEGAENFARQVKLDTKDENISITKTACFHSDCQLVALQEKHCQTMWGDLYYKTMTQSHSIMNVANSKYDNLFKLYFETADLAPLTSHHWHILQDNSGWCALKTAFRYQPADVCLKLIDKVSIYAINQALGLQDKDGWCPLMNAFRSQPADVCLKLIEKSSSDALNKALGLQEKDGWCPLKSAFRYQPADVCLKLIDKVSTDAINQALGLQDKKGWCTLMNAFRYQPADVCLKLIDKVSTDAINQALGLQDKEGWCALTIAVGSQSTDVFYALVKKCDAVTLAKAAILKPKRYHLNAFNESAQYQGAAGFNTLLQKMHEPDAKKILNDFFQHHHNELFKSVNQVALFQSGENILLFLNLLDDALIKLICDAAEKNITSYSVRSAYRAMQIKANAFLRHNEEAKNLSVNSLAQLAIPLENYEKLTSESKSPEVKTSPREADTIKLFMSGNALVKIIREDKGNENHFKEFIKYLKNPTLRQKLRKDKKTTGYKYVHIPRHESKQVIKVFSKGHIVQCRTSEEQKQHTQNKQKRGYQHTKKTPATLISKNLHTGLFGLADSREIVGLAFNADPNVTHIKAMLTQDYGTVRRSWVDNELGEVINYANLMQNISCMQIADFVERIDQQPYVVNEVLVKLKPDALSAIVIGRDTPAARKIARVRYDIISNEFNQALPILMYDPEHLSIKPYTPLEQHADEELENLQQQLASAKPGLFSRLFNQVYTIQLDTNKTTVTREQLQVLKPMLNTLLANVANKKITSLEAMEKAKSLLEHGDKIAPVKYLKR